MPKNYIPTCCALLVFLSCVSVKAHNTHKLKYLFLLDHQQAQPASATVHIVMRVPSHVQSRLDELCNIGSQVTYEEDMPPVVIDIPHPQYYASEAGERFGWEHSFWRTMFFAAQRMCNPWGHKEKQD